MQNRRITDAAFAIAGAEITPAAETNSIITLFTFVRAGPWSSIVPGQLLALMPLCEELVALPLSVPEVSHSVGIVTADRTPLPPVAQALLRLATAEGLASRMSQMVRDALAERGISEVPPQRSRPAGA
jgi:DNA-binding transcriptional LysR family regulator